VARDFSKAREAAKKAGDDAVGDQLDAIMQVADEFEEIFDDLKLTDRATYDSLIEVVQDATSKNESIASVIDRVKALGDAGSALASKVGDITSRGSLAALRGSLGL
jgi:hypothetical protein